MSGKDGRRKKIAGTNKAGPNRLGKGGRALLISEVELLLAEKRTSLSTMRTGIGLLPIPLSVFMVLISTSSYYEPEKLVVALVTISVFCLCLVAIGLYLISNSIGHIRHIDGKIRGLRKRDQEVGNLIEDPGLRD